MFRYVSKLKVLTNEKIGGLAVVSFDRSGYSLCDFQTNRCKPHPLRGIKQLSEPYFYYLQTIVVSQRRKKNCCRYLNFADFLDAGGGNTRLWCDVSQVFLN
jgi:hypothetical protein